MYWAAELKAGSLYGYKADMTAKQRANKLNKALKTLRSKNTCTRLTKVQRKLQGVYNLMPRGRKARRIMERDACNISRLRRRAKKKGVNCPARITAKDLGRACKFKR
jgi:uncharacterized metal-binding protein